MAKKVKTVLKREPMKRGRKLKPRLGTATLAGRIGRALAEERKKCGMTLAQVSAATGLSINTIANYELGLTTPSLDKLVSVASAIRADPLKLIQDAMFL